MESQSREELFADAARARRDAKRFRKAAGIVKDEVVELSLIARMDELERLAELLEAQAERKKRSTELRNSRGISG